MGLELTMAAENVSRTDVSRRRNVKLGDEEVKEEEDKWQVSEMRWKQSWMER